MSQASPDEEFRQEVQVVWVAISNWERAVAATKQAAQDVKNAQGEQAIQAAKSLHAIHAAKAAKGATAVIEAMTKFREVARRLASGRQE